MSEELLKAIIQLFAIVAREERITEEARNTIREFLGLHVNREAIRFYLNLFDELYASQPEVNVMDYGAIDPLTQQFVDDWSNIMRIARKVNQSLTMQQKLVLVVKVIELVHAEASISDRDSNLIFYIGQALKVSNADVHSLQVFVSGHDMDELASKNVLIIDEGSDDKPYPGPRLVEKNLNGMVAILRLPEAEMYFIKYLGITTLYLNGVLLRSRRIDVFPTGSTLRGDKTEPIYYSDIVGKFLIRERQSRITLHADHVFYHFQSGKAGLQNINLAVEGGKLIGIMGASGSGKSTLLNVLNGIEKPSSGRVNINGTNIHENPEKIEGVIGYVPQDDFLIEELTVFENLYYAACLCFRHYTDNEIVLLVQRTIQNLGLTEIQHLMVGNPMNKVISGGQRKRINIGLELLREPTFLFVDEPTSGLSSRDSENIMDLLKELSLRGKMVFIVIHQPSSEIFKMFDNLLILDVGGFQIYYGNPVEAVNYFRDMVNASVKNIGACPECGNINPEQIFNIIEMKVVNEYGRLTHARKVSPGQWYQYFKQKIQIPKVIASTEKIMVAQQIPYRWDQFKIFIQRDVFSKLANHQYLFINFLEAPLLAFFIAFMVKYYNVLGGGSATYSFYENHNIPVYFFMSIVVALFFGLITSAEEIYKDRKILKREQFLNLSRGSYLLSKVAVMFSIAAIQTLSYMVVAHWILEIPLSEFRYWLVLFACSCFASMLGLNISSAFNSAVTIYIIIPILIIPQLLLSGVVISFDKFNPKVSMPVGVPIMGETMASRWAFEALMVTQFKDNPYEKMFYGLDQVIYESEYKQVYYIPMLESKLAYCFNARSSWHKPDDVPFRESLALLHHEIGHELTLIGERHFQELPRLVPGKFDSTVFAKTRHFFVSLKRYYAMRRQRAMDQREKVVQALMGPNGNSGLLDKQRKRYVNQAVTDAVKNTVATDRIVEFEGRLLQKIYPIYLDDMAHPIFNISSNLYQPYKFIAHTRFDTFWVNLTVIWAMTFVLYWTLHVDLLKKAVFFMESMKSARRKERG